MGMKKIGLLSLFLLFFVLYGCEKKTEMLKNPEEKKESDTPKKEERGTVFTLSFLREEEGENRRFFITVRLPNEWTVMQEGEETLPYIPVKSKYHFFDEKKEYIGFVGSNTYESKNMLSDDPNIIYKKLLEDPIHKYDLENSYEIINKTYEGDVAVVNIFHLTNGEKTDIHSGILAFNRLVLSFVSFELDPDKVGKEVLEKIAKSIKFM